MTDRRRILGAVIAGGLSRRFGSDKALAMIGGHSMMAHVVAALRPQVDGLVVCGRAWPDTEALADLREGRIGPLAGLEAALHFAAEKGFDGVLSIPVDTLPLPFNLNALLVGNHPTVLRHQYLIGYWPIYCRSRLSHHIDSGGRSLRSWVEQSLARLVDEPFAITNINRPSDLEALDGAG